MATKIEWCEDTWNPIVHRIGKKDAGRLLDGRVWEEYPDV